MQINNSYELLEILKKQNLLKDDGLWWQNSGTFEVLIGAILTQNTKWDRVESSLNNLKNHNLNTLESIANCDIERLKFCIQKCAFVNQKSLRLKTICMNIIDEFGDFENFRDLVSREWLLKQRGIGDESADCILNYACYRDVMVVDKYTQKLLAQMGFEFLEYESMQKWIENGIKENYEKIKNLYGYEIEIYKVYARLHGKIVEFSKMKIPLSFI